MFGYTIRRLLAMIPALLGIATITFILMHMTKGGPFESEKASAAVKAAQMRAYHLDEPMWPTFLGAGSDIGRYIVLALGVVLALVAIAMLTGRLPGSMVLRSLFLFAGSIFIMWFLLMLTQSPGTANNTGFVPGQYLRYLNNLLHGDLGNSFSYPARTVNSIIGASALNSLFLGVAAFTILVCVGIPLGIIAALRQNTWIDYVATGLSLLGYSIPNFVMGILLIIITGTLIHPSLIPIAVAVLS
jgi:ABC-type dipeptide/oligopeptide/nickel transport system permease component